MKVNKYRSNLHKFYFQSANYTKLIKYQSIKKNNVKRWGLYMKDLYRYNVYLFTSWTQNRVSAWGEGVVLKLSQAPSDNRIFLNYRGMHWKIKICQFSLNFVISIHKLISITNVEQCMYSACFAVYSMCVHNSLMIR